MREFGSSSLSLAGSLLIAHPTLLDPNFHKTVLFLSTHDPEEGSFGLVLNRPAGRVVSEVLPDKLLGPLAQVPVFIGGPVGTDQLSFASFKWHDATGVMECRHHLVIDEAGEAAEDSTLIVRGFIGYAGWSKGQLDGELEAEGWLTKKPDPSVFELERCPTLWRELTKGFGPWFQLAAEAPDDFTQN